MPSADHSSNYNRGGFIRFVGGSRHNQHLCVVWKPFISFYVRTGDPTPAAFWSIDDYREHDKVSFEKEDYQLVWMNFGLGNHPMRHFPEYHCRGVTLRQITSEIPEVVIDGADRALREPLCEVMLQVLRFTAWQQPGRGV